jgi:hypothetical protein
MKKVKSLYFIAALFFIIIIISLFIGSTENFELNLGSPQRTFKGPFTKNCIESSCKYDDLEKTLSCTCRNDAGKEVLSKLKFSEADLISLKNKEIINNNGTLSMKMKN